MALHPQAQAFLDAGREAGIPSLARLTPQQAREQARTMIDHVGAGPEVGTVEDFEIPAVAGPVPARLYEPDGARSTVATLRVRPDLVPPRRATPAAS